MAANYKYTGKRIKVIAAAARASGAVVSDDLAGGAGQVAGICLAAVASSETYTIAVGGVFNVPVPAATAAGALVYAPGNTNGPTAGNVALSVDAAGNTLFGKTLTDADASNKADVLVLEPRY